MSELQVSVLKNIFEKKLILDFVAHHVIKNSFFDDILMNEFIRVGTLSMSVQTL